MRSKRPPPKSISTAAMASLRDWRGREGVRVVRSRAGRVGGVVARSDFCSHPDDPGRIAEAPARAGAFVRGDARAIPRRVGGFGRAPLLSRRRTSRPRGDETAAAGWGRCLGDRLPAASVRADTPGRHPILRRGGSPWGVRVGDRRRKRSDTRRRRARAFTPGPHRWFASSSARTRGSPRHLFHLIAAAIAPRETPARNDAPNLGLFAPSPQKKGGQQIFQTASHAQASTAEGHLIQTREKIISRAARAHRRALALFGKTAGW